MTNASQQFLDPEVIQRISDLEVRAREIIEGTISGRHRSPAFGQSVEFAQHREYVRGDDLRRLDWKAFAKRDRLYVKQFEEETNLRATLLVDVSSSMRYGSGETNKHDYSCKLAACLAYLLLRQSDAVGLVSFDEAVRGEAPHRTSNNHLRTLLHRMFVDEPAKKTDLEAVLKRVMESEVHRGMVVLFSDLLAQRDSVERALKLLRRRRHDVIVFHLMHDDEVDFLFRGNTRFEGLESDDMLTCDPRALREDYLAALERFLERIRGVSGRLGIDYRFVRTSEAIDAVLSALLSERLRPA